MEAMHGCTTRALASMQRTHVSRSVLVNPHRVSAGWVEVSGGTQIISGTLSIGQKKDLCPPWKSKIARNFVLEISKPTFLRCSLSLPLACPLPFLQWHDFLRWFASAFLLSTDQVILDQQHVIKNGPLWFFVASKWNIHIYIYIHIYYTKVGNFIILKWEMYHFYAMFCSFTIRVEIEGRLQ